MEKVRGLIISSKGRKILLKIANCIAKKYPDMYLIVLLIDERPEVTDMQRSIRGDVVYSTFDELRTPYKVAEMVLERAQGRAWSRCSCLLDIITRLSLL